MSKFRKEGKKAEEKRQRNILDSSAEQVEKLQGAGKRDVRFWNEARDIHQAMQNMTRELLDDDPLI